APPSPGGPEPDPLIDPRLCASPGGQDPLQVSTRTTPLADGGKRQLGVAKDGAEDVVELMRDPAGERSNGLEPLRLMQPRLKHLTLGLAALALDGIRKNLTGRPRQLDVVRPMLPAGNGIA